MRTNDALIGIVAATLGFGAVVAAAAKADWAAVTALAVTAALLFIYAAGRAIVTPRILVVGDPDGPGGARRMGALEGALEEAGFGVVTCDGPTHHPCPVLAGGPCPVHGHPSAVVVFHPAGYAGPVPPCGQALGLPELTIDDGSDHEPQIDHWSARVGSARGLDTALDTLTTLAPVPTKTRIG